jgi:preprotein translocase subunit SecY
MFNMFSGVLVAIHHLRAGIMPYISASIIMQLMTVVSPTLEALKREGESAAGRHQYTRYGTLFRRLSRGWELPSRWNRSVGW